MRLELSTMRTQATPAASGLMSQWRVGAIVEAVAVRSVDDGQLWLNIGSVRVPARIASGDPAGPLNGERLQLRVLRDSPVVALETILADDQEAATVNDGLRRFLPRQASSAPLFANLALLTDRGGEPFGRQIAEAAQRLWRALPDDAQLTTPEGLATAVKRSGAFLEHQLAFGDAGELQQTIANDLKALLSSLKQALTHAGATAQRTDASRGAEPLPNLRGPLAPLNRAAPSLANIESPARAINELAGQVEGALARLNTLQLVNAEASSLSSTWLLEVPFRHGGNPETLRFRFERNSRNNQAEQNWTIEAAMDLGVGGALHARVALHGARVGVQLRAESPKLLAALQANTNALIGVLQESGLQVERVQCIRGLPIEGQELRTAPMFAMPLLDIRV